MDLSFFYEENITKKKLITIEEKIKKIVGDDPDKLSFRKTIKEQLELLENLLQERKWILNQLFEYTPDNIERIKKIDHRLRNLSLKLHERVQAMDSKSTLILDDPDFDDDYEIEGTLQFSWDDENSVLGLDDDKFYGSDFNSMIHIIDRFYYAKGRFASDILSINRRSKNMDDEIDWNESPLLHPELNICFATYVICCHKVYSIPDLLRLNDFWAEVKFIEQNIRDAEGKKHEDKE